MVMFGENHFGGLKYCFRPQVKGDVIQAGVQPSGTAFAQHGSSPTSSPSVCLKNK